jgi:transglutaminase-like putative cysteine protease
VVLADLLKFISMHKLLLGWLLLLIGEAVYASDDTSPFGKVTKEELSATYYPLDSTAEAVFLRNNGKVHISYEENLGFRAHYTREVKIKIYRTSGFDWADVVLPYYVKDKYKAEMIQDIEGFSYTLHGDAIQKNGLEKKDVFTEEVNEAYSQKKFAFPNVREGSIIEYKYTMVSPYIFQLDDWKFQYEIPVKWSEFTAKIPAFYEYQMLYQGYVPLIKNEAELEKWEQRLGQYTYNNAKYLWAVENVPAFSDESFISNKDDYIAKLTFQLTKENFPGRSVRDYMETWPQLTDDLLKLTDFGKYLKRKDGKETVEQLTAGLSADLEKARAIYNYLTGLLRWNGKISLYPDTSPKELLETKTGNSTDLNILLTNWLNLAGINASPVLLSTRAHGRIQTKYPKIDQFNYAVVHTQIEGKDYLLDISDPAQPLGMIPIYCLNNQGLLVDSKEERWVPLESGQVYQVDNYYNVGYQESEDQFAINVNHVYRGYGALTARQQLRDQPEEVTGYQQTDFKVMDELALEKNLRISYTRHSGGRHSGIEKLGDYIYIETFPNSPVSENPFKATQRKHPIDYNYRRVYKQTLNIQLPDGYEVEELPASQSLALEGNTAQFVFRSQVTAVSVQVVSLLRINRSLIAPEQYQQLRNLYEEMLVKHQEKIVLHKVKTE